MREHEKQQFSPNRAKDRSIILLLIGTAMLLPPLIGVSLVDAKIFGIPVPLVYIFVVWMFLVLGARLLARSLMESDQFFAGSERNGRKDP